MKRTEQCVDCGAPIYPVSKRCSQCDKRLRRAGSAAGSVENFWARVDRTGECWVWTGGRNPKGYGSVHGSLGPTAHRAAYRMANGDIPAGLHVLHRCDNPPCCNPAHLYLGSNRDNVADRVARSRSVAKLTPEKVRAIRRALESGVPRRDIVREYGMSPTAIDVLARGASWRHVA